MGNTNASGDPNHNMEELFRIIKNDGTNGMIFLEQKLSGKEYLRKEITTNSVENFNRVTSLLESRKSCAASLTHLLSIKELYSHTEKHFCSDVYKLFMLLEYPFRNLAEEIEERRQSSDWFSENQILTIIFSCCLGLKELYSAGYKHEGLMTSKIFIEKDGLIKISDPYLLGQQPNHLVVGKKDLDDHIYLSPEQLQFQQTQQAKYDAEQSDVFTLGMLALETIYLRSMDDVYAESNTKINKVKLNEFVMRIDNRYSDKLKQIVESMLVYEPGARCTLQDIQHTIESESFDEDTASLPEPSKKKLVTRESVQSIPQPQPLQQINNSENCPNSMNVFQKKPASDKHFKAQNGSLNANKPVISLQPRDTMHTIIDKFKQSNICSVQKQNIPTVFHGDHHAIETFTTTPSLESFQPQNNKFLHTPSMPNINNHSNLPSAVGYTTNVYPSYTLPKYNSNPSLMTFEPFVPQKYAAPTSALSYGNYESALSSGYGPFTNPALLKEVASLNTPSFSYQPYVPMSSFVPSSAYFPPPSFKSNPQPLSTLPTHGLNLNSVPVASPIIVPTYSWNQTNIPELSKMTQDSRPTDSSIQNTGKPSFKEIHSLSPAANPTPAQTIQNQLSPVEQLETPQKQNSESRRKTKMQRNSFGSSSCYNQATPLLPNSTIAEVTETEMSCVNTSKREDVEVHSPKPVVIRDDDLKFEREDYEQGSRYQGYKYNGMRHGFGRFYYQDGGYYEGEWQNNRMHGFAKLYYQDGQIAYEGYWLNDQFHGKGKVFNDNPKSLNAPFDYSNFAGLDEYWISYEGDFIQDSKHGLGCVKLSNGEVFEGNFDRDIIEGEGKYFGHNGEIIRGIWRDNRLVQRY